MVFNANNVHLMIALLYVCVVDLGKFSDTISLQPQLPPLNCLYVCTVDFVNFKVGATPTKVHPSLLYLCIVDFVTCKGAISL